MYISVILKVDDSVLDGPRSKVSLLDQHSELKIKAEGILAATSVYYNVIYQPYSSQGF